MSIISSIKSATDELDGNVSIKWANDGVFHRFWLSVNASFDDLMKLIKAIDPNFDDYLTYEDENGDTICLKSTLELKEFIWITAEYDLPRFITTTSKKPPSVKTLKPTLTFPKILPRVAPKVHHRGIICSACEFPVIGMRYNCTECNDYNLCEMCEKTGMHDEHSMIRFVTEACLKPSFVHLNRTGAFGDSPSTDRGNGEPFLSADNALTDQDEPLLMKLSNKDEERRQHAAASMESTALERNPTDALLHSLFDTVNDMTNTCNQILNVDDLINAQKNDSAKSPPSISGTSSLVSSTITESFDNLLDQNTYGDLSYSPSTSPLCCSSANSEYEVLSLPDHEL